MCIYSDDGPVTSIITVMRVTVMTASAPRTARMLPTAVYGRFGHPLELECHGSRNTKPPPHVTWFKDGVAVVMSARLQVESTRSAEFTWLFGERANWLALIDSRYSQKFCPDLSAYLCLSADFRRYKQLQLPGNRLPAGVVYLQIVYGQTPGVRILPSALCGCR